MFMMHLFLKHSLVPFLTAAVGYGLLPQYVLLAALHVRGYSMNSHPRKPKRAAQLKVKPVVALALKTRAR